MVISECTEAPALDESWLERYTADTSPNEEMGAVLAEARELFPDVFAF